MPSLSVRLLWSVPTQSLIYIIQLALGRSSNTTKQHRIHADMGGETYLVEVQSPALWGRRIKIIEMDASDIKDRIHSQWRECGILGKRPSSYRRPEDWTEDISKFVQESVIGPESLVSLIARFDIKYSKMVYYVGIALFNFERGNVHLVSGIEELFD